jgi:hypothetical protein
MKVKELIIDLLDECGQVIDTADYASVRVENPDHKLELVYDRSRSEADLPAWAVCGIRAVFKPVRGKHVVRERGLQRITVVGPRRTPSGMVGGDILTLNYSWTS